MGRDQVRVGRRTLLLGAGAAPLLAGCGALLPGERREPRPPTADELAVERAIADAVRLRAAAVALTAAQPQLADLLGRVIAGHDEHLTALGADATATPSETGRGIRTDARGQRDAEWGAARTALRDAAAAEPGPAVLLARIAAARAVHADLVAAAVGLGAPAAELDPAPPEGGATPAPSPTAAGGAPAPSPGAAAELPDADADALGRLLAGEHAAVFAYPVVVSRVAPSRRDAADGLWQQHVAERDSLERWLVAAGGEPPAASPAYDVEVPADQAAALALGARVEDGLAALAVAAIPTTTGEARLYACRRLAAAARRSASWTGTPTPFPG